jgi:hypothetical protein
LLSIIFQLFLDTKELIDPPYFDLKYNCGSKEGQLDVVWNDEEKQLRLAYTQIERYGPYTVTLRTVLRT